MSITDDYESHLMAYLRHGMADGEKGTWVGLRLMVDPQNGEQSYEYTDEWPAYRIPWAKGQPDSSHLREPHFVYEKGGRFYTTTDPQLKLPFMCKIHQTPMPPKPDYSHLVCPQEDYASRSFQWYDLDPQSPSCYWISDIVQTSGTEARQACRRLNATLVSFHSDHELKAVDKLSIKLTGSIVWIGLWRKAHWTPWRWDDGTELDFENWDEPPFSYAECAYMYTKTTRWMGAGCNRAANFICATPKVPPSSLEAKVLGHPVKTVGIVIGVIIALSLLSAIVVVIVWIRKSERGPSIITKITWNKLKSRSNSMTEKLTTTRSP